MVSVERTWVERAACGLWHCYLGDFEPVDDVLGLGVDCPGVDEFLGIVR